MVWSVILANLLSRSIYEIFERVSETAGLVTTNAIFIFACLSEEKHPYYRTLYCLGCEGNHVLKIIVLFCFAEQRTCNSIVATNERIGSVNAILCEFAAYHEGYTFLAFCRPFANGFHVSVKFFVFFHCLFKF